MSPTHVSHPKSGIKLTIVYLRLQYSGGTHLGTSCTDRSPVWDWSTGGIIIVEVEVAGRCTSCTHGPYLYWLVIAFSSSGSISSLRVADGNSSKLGALCHFGSSVLIQYKSPTSHFLPSWHRVSCARLKWKKKPQKCLWLYWLWSSIVWYIL